MIDGTIVPFTVDETFERGAEARVAYLVGSNALEFPPGTFPARSPAADAVEQLKRRLLVVARTYESPESYDENILSDVLFTEPARRLAALHSRNGSPTYLYRFSVLAEAAPFKLAAHGADRQYVFGNLDTLLWPYGPRDVSASNTMSAYWVAFARHGDPNGAGRPGWPRYTSVADELIEFTNDGPVMRRVPAAGALDAIGATYR